MFLESLMITGMNTTIVMTMAINVLIKEALKIRKAVTNAETAKAIPTA